MMMMIMMMMIPKNASAISIAAVPDSRLDQRTVLLVLSSSVLISLMIWSPVPTVLLLLKCRSSLAMMMMMMMMMMYEYS